MNIANHSATHRNNRRFQLGDAGGLIIHPVVQAWVSQCSVNANSVPSTNTQRVLSIFYNGLLSNPTLFAKIKSVNCVVPDSLYAASVPLINNYGNNPWTNNNFISGDLSVKGLAGNGSNKYFNTGIVPSAAYTSDNIGGITVYVSVNPNTANTDLDVGVATGGGAQSCYISGCYATDALWHYCNNVSGQGALSTGTLPIFTGYYSGNRLSATNSVLYIANSIYPHAQFFSISTNGGTRPTQACFAWGNNSAGSLQLPSHKTMSFVAFHDGLTFQESQALYTLVQAMRKNLGGGYV